MAVDAILDLGVALNASKAKPDDKALDAIARDKTARVMGIAAALGREVPPAMSRRAPRSPAATLLERRPVRRISATRRPYPGADGPPSPSSTGDASEPSAPAPGDP